MGEFHYVRIQGHDGGVDVLNGAAEGLELEVLIKDGLPPFNIALELIASLAEILIIAEEDGENHGDISPDWVTIDGDGTVSIEGFGLDRGRTRAPERRPRGHATDLYGLGYTAYRLLSPHEIEQLSSDPDEHDDAIIDAVVVIPFGALPEDLLGDIQWYLAKLMSFDPAERPPALEVWRTFIAYANDVGGEDYGGWCRKAVKGGGAKRREDTASIPFPHPNALRDSLPGVEVMSGPIVPGAIHFGADAGNKGPATAFWTRDQMKSAIAPKKDGGQAFRPAVGGGERTSFWSQDEMAAMAEGREDAPRPRRRSHYNIPPRPNAESANQGPLARREPPRAAAPPPPPPRRPPAAPPPPPPRRDPVPDDHTQEPQGVRTSSRVRPAPEPPPPVPVATRDISASIHSRALLDPYEPEDEEEDEGTSMWKYIFVGFAVVFLLFGFTTLLMLAALIGSLLAFSQ